MDDFIEEFYEEWMDTVIEQIPLTNRAPPHNEHILEYNDYYNEELSNDEQRGHNHYHYNNTIFHQSVGDDEFIVPNDLYYHHPVNDEEFIVPDVENNNYEQPNLYPNHIHNQIYQNLMNNLQIPTTSNNETSINDTLVNNLYRLRRTLQIQNELNRQSNSIFDELISLVTDGLTENIPNDIDLEDVKVVLTPEQFDKLKKNIIILMLFNIT
jgi:hypothetical protein